MERAKSVSCVLCAAGPDCANLTDMHTASESLSCYFSNATFMPILRKPDVSVREFMRG
jgi:hypothetical protein